MLVISRVPLDIFPIDRSFNRIDAVVHRRLPASSCDISFRTETVVVQNRNRYQRHFLLSAESTTTTANSSERPTNSLSFSFLTVAPLPVVRRLPFWYMPGRREQEMEMKGREIVASRYVSAFTGGNGRLFYKDRNE